jgi:hypothetical protein
MRLCNIWKSLTWNSLLSRRNRHLRRRPALAPCCLAAEVCEDRRLLSGTVNVVQSGNSLTLTADANHTAGSTPTFELHRINATTVQVDDAGSGTLIAKNGAFGSAGAVQTFSISSVANVTVNLGTGYDTFSMFDLSTLGNVTIKGKTGAGALGSDVEIYSNSADVTIGGSIIESLGLQTGANHNKYNIDAAGGHNFTVNGNIAISDAHSGVSGNPSDADTDVKILSDAGSSSNNLLVKGAVSVSMKGTGTGHTLFALDAQAGTATVNGPVIVSQSGSTDMSFLTTAESGAALIVNGEVEDHVSGAGNSALTVETRGTGGSSTLTLNSELEGFYAGTGSHTTSILAEDDGGPVSINSDVTILNSGTGASALIIQVADASNSPIAFAGNVIFVDTGTGPSRFDMLTDGDGSPITVNGSVTYDNSHNTKSYSQVEIAGSTDEEQGDLPIVTIKGNLTLLLGNDVSTTPDSAGKTSNSVFIGEDEGDNGNGVGTVVGGVTTIVGGRGQDQITLAEAQFQLGAVVNTVINPSGGGFNDLLEVDGSLIGGAFQVAMAGPGAEIDINNGGGFQTTEFVGPVAISMPGSLPRIVIADGSGSGYSPVKFDSSVAVAGIPGGGGIFEYDPSNVTFAFAPVLSNFTTVLS